MRIRLPWSSRMPGLMQLCLILSTISLLVDSAALPVKTGRSLASDAPSIAAALNSDHVSFEPKSSYSSSKTSTTRFSSRDTTDATTDPLNTDPYTWELCCAPEGTWKCNMALTNSCRDNNRFRCELDGTLTHRKDNDECSKLCACFEWSESEGKPPTIAARGSKNDKDKKKEEEAKAKAKAQKAWAKAMEAASPSEFVDFPLKVTRGERRHSTSPRPLSKSEEKPSRHSANVKELTDKDTLIITTESAVEESMVPPGGQNADYHAGKTQLEKRHNYALVCELQGMRDVHITRSCAASPRQYSCDRLGGLFKRRYDSYCDQHCACQYMNTNPMFKHGGSFSGL